MTERPLPPPLRLLDAIGRWAIAVVEALGRFGTFLAQEGAEAAEREDDVDDPAAQAFHGPQGRG